MKSDTVKAIFKKFLVDNEWTCKNGELLATEIESVSGEVRSN